MNVLLLSGGLDSLVLLAQECQRGQKPFCLSFDYGQRHRKELDAGKAIARHYGCPRSVIVLPVEILAGSTLTGTGEIPRGARYDDSIQQSTVVPNRNLLFISVAGSIAARLGGSVVLFAAQATDAAIYPDCRKWFVEAASIALRLACGVSVAAPLINLTKTEVVRLGKKLEAPLHLAWSCYLGGESPCGQCGACVEREEAETAAT